ncbi:hypothetical protein QBC35DRAFT_533374 [Podospora australis]|uniref:Uncharacterized protein n=1 Tax=Podospora australis TaxID=1536484 RepID=A0AAN6WTY3_9PEZI|nr:hypothetical protein QBC35DRAFT_533374 [Podospora australis]
MPRWSRITATGRSQGVPPWQSAYQRVSVTSWAPLKRQGGTHRRLSSPKTRVDGRVKGKEVSAEVEVQVEVAWSVCRSSLAALRVAHFLGGSQPNGSGGARGTHRHPGTAVETALIVGLGGIHVGKSRELRILHLIEIPSYRETEGRHVMTDSLFSVLTQLRLEALETERTNANFGWIMYAVLWGYRSFFVGPMMKPYWNMSPVNSGHMSDFDSFPSRPFPGLGGAGPLSFVESCTITKQLLLFLQVQLPSEITGNNLPIGSW